QTGVRFRQTGNNIAVYCPPEEKPESAQTGVIKGTVINAETGEPMPGVSVFLEGTTKGDATDLKGKFKITDVVPGQYTLIARFVGYKDYTKKITVLEGSTTKVNFKLVPKKNELDELIVTGFYSMPLERSTGSVTHITAEELEATTGLNLRDKLRGLVPGLMFAPNF